MGEISQSMAEVKQATSLRAYANDHLQHARGALVCPYCGSGGHGTASSDSAFSIRADRFTCFSCGKKGDIFDLAAAVEGIDESNKVAQLQAVANWAGIAVEKQQCHPLKKEVRQSDVQAPAKTKPEADYSAGRARHRAFILQARADIDAPEAVSYLEARGYTLEEARAAGMGYDRATKRLVIPWRGSDYYHIDRDTTGRAAHKYEKPKSDEVGPQPVYNPEALNGESFFVVEGALDAIALQTLGFEAVALGGVGINALVTALQAVASKPTALLMFDRDETGERSKEAAAKTFTEARLPYRLVEFFEGLRGKDADEMRKNSPEALKSILSGEVETVALEREQEREKAYSAALDSLRVVSPMDVAANIYLCEGLAEPVPTGFPAFDAATGGGLPVGLTTLGAVSSLGKTTLALQMADQMAAAGVPVLFVTIEQSARELVGKSLSRYMAAEMPGAPSASEINNPKRRAAWPGERIDALAAACGEYTSDTQGRLHILEGTNQPAVADIEAAARKIGAHDGRQPVIFIDYLQLLKPQNERDGDKQATDKNVMSLRQMARDLQTPVFVISSLNRASYAGVVNLESFKESGAIEYGSDLLLGLQPSEFEDALDGVAESKAKGEANKVMRKHKAGAVRSCELRILKNRNGATPADGLQFTFNAVHSSWVEDARRA